MQGKGDVRGNTSLDTYMQRLEKIPKHLRIKILHSDEQIIVVNKPSLLRSVPGNIKERDYSEEVSSIHQNTARTMQQAWIEAIRFYHDKQRGNDAVACALQRNPEPTKSLDGELKSNAIHILARLAAKSDNIVKSISRKGGAFRKYVSKNVKTILPHLMMSRKDMNTSAKFDSNRITIEEASKIAFDVLNRKSHSIHHEKSLSHRTKDEDSALGQLKLLVAANGKKHTIKQYGNLHPVNQQDPIHVVHRLDCETSGVMVFARTVAAASKLSNAWRERKVSKVYHARVWNWPPFENDGQTKGIIDLALAPMENERLKWEVKDEKLGGKPSQTIWRIVMNDEEGTSARKEDCGRKQNPFILELKPITGRTHQLRVHCEHVGSGIIGDSLYGDNPIQLKDEDAKEEIPDMSLRLHALRLSFPHPNGGENSVENYTCDHCWTDEDKSSC